MKTSVLVGGIIFNGLEGSVASAVYQYSTCNRWITEAVHDSKKNKK